MCLSSQLSPMKLQGTEPSGDSGLNFLCRMPFPLVSHRVRINLNLLTQQPLRCHRRFSLCLMTWQTGYKSREDVWKEVAPFQCHEFQEVLKVPGRNKLELFPRNGVEKSLQKSQGLAGTCDPLFPSSRIFCAQAVAGGPRASGKPQSALQVAAFHLPSAVSVLSKLTVEICKLRLKILVLLVPSFQTFDKMQVSNIKRYLNYGKFCIKQVCVQLAMFTLEQMLGKIFMNTVA